MSKLSLKDRREQLSKAGSTMFIVVAVSSVVVMFSLISLRFLKQRFDYNNRVIIAKREARKQIESNNTNLDKLSKQYPDLENSATTNVKTILHALPPAYDYAALANSIDSLALQSGVKSDTNIGEDTSASAVMSAATSTPIEIPLTISAEGNYEAINKYVLNLEHSIRPILIKTIDYSGTNGSLKVTIAATTYYQPSRTLEVERKPIQ